MKSRWSDQGAREAVDRWAEAVGEGVALRIYSARLLGSDPALVLHGGGNVSVKGMRQTILGDEVEAVYVKASGYDLARLTPEALPGIDLQYLRRLRSLDELSDQQMVNELRTHLFDAAAPTPSIEALLHAFLPHQYVDHSHADAVLTLTNQPDGRAMIRDALGDRVAIVDYVKPGFDLAKAVADTLSANPKVEGIVLLFHGLITFGDDARTAYERHIGLVDACERFIESRIADAGDHGPTATPPTIGAADAPETSAAKVAPMLRGLIARPTGDEDQPYDRPIMEWRASPEILGLIGRDDAQSLADCSPLTGDHLIHTKPTPLFVDILQIADANDLRATLHRAEEDYRSAYTGYIDRHGGPDQTLDASPRVVLIPGAGMFCWGPTKRAARITADIAEHTLIVKAQANTIGRYTALSDNHLYDMEHRSLQRSKIERRSNQPLAGQVVVISGGAGAIGSAVATVCAESGAHVALADVSEERVSRTVEQIDARFGSGTAFGVVMDVTEDTAVRDGFDRIVRMFGGVDILVPNAGIAHVAAIEDMRTEDFRRVMEVNATGYLIFMREGIRVLKQQGLGGNIVISASKNVFGPGKDFGAYSSSKAAGHQLGRVAAIELAPYGIRVNMINADAVFGDDETPSGLWQTVGPDRAKSRNLSEEDLPEYYRRRNLLKTRVRGEHVGRAVVFFASNATPTTGSTLPIDGGVVDAFPR